MRRRVFNRLACGGLALWAAAVTAGGYRPPLLDPGYAGDYEREQRRQRELAAEEGVRVIYGKDNRIDAYQADARVRDVLRATPAFVFTENLKPQAGGQAYRAVGASSLRQRQGVCAEEPFADQPSLAFCTGFLVAPDLVATAGHCLNEKSLRHALGDIRIVFDYAMRDAREARLTFPRRDVYRVVERVAFRLDRQGDWGLVRLDRKVEGRRPVAIRIRGDISPGTALTVVGFPAGLPLKVADGGVVRDSQPASTKFLSDLDTYGGNSGSPVFDTHSIMAGSPRVEGILVSGATDFVETARGCRVSNRCDRMGAAQGGCGGEQSTKIANIAGSVPSRSNTVKPEPETPPGAGGEIDLGALFDLDEAAVDDDSGDAPQAPDGAGAVGRTVDEEDACRLLGGLCGD